MARQLSLYNIIWLDICCLILIVYEDRVVILNRTEKGFMTMIRTQVRPKNSICSRLNVRSPFVCKMISLYMGLCNSNLRWEFHFKVMVKTIDNIKTWWAYNLMQFLYHALDLYGNGYYLVAVWSISIFDVSLVATIYHIRPESNVLHMANDICKVNTFIFIPISIK